MHKRGRLGFVLALTLAGILVLPGAAWGSTGSTRALPNLTWSSYSYSSGCTFQLFNVTVMNNGDADAGPAVVTNRVDRKFVGAARYDQVLPPGGLIDVGPFPSVTVSRGAHLATFYLDARQQVTESNELDNLIAFAFVCT